MTLFLSRIFNRHVPYRVGVVIFAKCRFCGKRIRGQGRRKIGFMYTPWKKPKFFCVGCKKEKSSLRELSKKGG